MNKIIELISKIIFLGVGLTGIVLYEYYGNYYLLIGGAGITVITMFDLEKFLYKNEDSDV